MGGGVWEGVPSMNNAPLRDHTDIMSQHFTLMKIYYIDVSIPRQSLSFIVSIASAHVEIISFLVSNHLLYPVFRTTYPVGT